MSRPTQRELHDSLIEILDDTWRTPSEFRALLDLGGSDWYRLCLALERLANDGYAELKTPGSTVRRFRRARADEPGISVVAPVWRTLRPSRRVEIGLRGARRDA